MRNTISYANPTHVAICEYDLALTYSLRNAKLAKDCILTSIEASIAAGRPDLTYKATTLLGTL